MDFLHKGHPKHPYNFRKDSYNPSMFAHIVGIDTQSPHFRSITTDLDNLRTKYLNTDACMTDQPIACESIRNELTMKYPHIFDGRHGHKHLFYALHIVMRHHSVDRRMIKSGKGRKSQYDCRYSRLRLKQVNDENVDPLDKRSTEKTITVQRPTASIIPRRASRNSPRLLLDCVLLSKRHKVPRMTVPGPLLAPSPMANGIAHNVDLYAYHGPPIFNICNGEVPPNYVKLPPNSRIIPTPSQQFLLPMDDIPNQMASCPPLSEPLLLQHASDVLDESMVQPHEFLPRLSASVAMPATQMPTVMNTPEIHKFLATCQPPMMHYLRCFVDFGCLTSTHLHSVSLWRAEQRYNLLRKICLSRRPGEVLPEMDIAILEYQFATYFLED